MPTTTADPKRKVSVAEWMRDHPVFIAWWKAHRHSGFIEDDDGRSHWTIPPWLAWNCDRYRVEYSSDCNQPYKRRYEYDAEDFESWARDQQQFEDYRGPVSKEAFMQQLRKALLAMGQMMDHKESQPGSKPQSQINNELHALHVRRPERR